MDTATMTVQGFLDALAAEESTPGGGGAAALAGSQAAALVSMVVRFTLGRRKYADVQAEMEGYLERSEALRQELLRLVDEDARAFDAVAACYGMPKETEEEKAARRTALQQALKGAAQVPFVTAERCLEVIHLAKPVGAKGNVNVVSDAAVAAHLAYAGLRSALINVRINLKFIRDEAFVAEWAERVGRLQQGAEALYQEALEACQQTLGVTV